MALDLARAPLSVDPTLAHTLSYSPTLTISSTSCNLWSTILRSLASDPIQLVNQTFVGLDMELALARLKVVDVEIPLEVPTDEVALCKGGGIEGGRPYPIVLRVLSAESLPLRRA